MWSPRFLRDRLQAAASVSRAAAAELERRAQAVLTALRDKTEQAHEVGQERLGGAAPSDWLATARRVGARVTSALRTREEAGAEPVKPTPTPVVERPAPPPPASAPMEQPTSLWARLRRFWHQQRAAPGAR